MKRKNGFTLIELLAVIVILAIIALVAVPIILNVIEKSKESSAVDSAYGYIHALEEGIVEAEVKNKTLVENKEYDDLASFESTYGINVKGTKPSGGTFRLEKRQVVYAEFIIGEYNITCDKKECVSNGKAVILTYNLDGGTLDREKDKVLKGNSTTLPIPTKEHYGFDGWYTEANGGGERVNNETIFNSSMTLYAKWTKNNYTVTFNAGENGTSSESSLSVEAEGTLTLPSASKEGHTFNGWFTEINGGSEVTNSTPILSSQTLYAHYTINTYTITYNAGDGTASESSAQVNHGSTLSLPTATKENYSLAGWYTAAENGNEVTEETPITSSQTLYAHYFTTKTNFDYTGNVQTFTVPTTGRYKLEVWGAQGGDYYTGGYGGYASGEISINASSKLYIYVGGKPTSTTGGWNGGGNGVSSGRGGGGATDISLQGTEGSSTWNETNHIYSRVIVAGGGGGSGISTGNVNPAGCGGGEYGGDGFYNYTDGSTNQKTCANRCGGGGGPTYAGVTWSTGGSASFGYGSNASGYSCGGGGGGWYGGAGAYDNDSDGDGRQGGGGSGYVYTSSTAANYPSGCLLNSSHYLTNTQNIAGKETFLAPSGSNETGHTGHGYARITYLGKN